MEKKIVNYLSCVIILFVFHTSNGQSVGINPTGATPNTASILDLSTGVTNMGFLGPQVALTNVTTWSPVVGVATNGMLVYNTSAATTGGSGVGYYYWANAQWNYFVNSGSFGALNACLTTNNVPKMANATTLTCSNIYDLGTTMSIFKSSPSAGYLFDLDPGTSAATLDTRILGQSGSPFGANGANLYLGAGSGGTGSSNGGNIYLVPGAKATTGSNGSAVVGSGDKTATPLGYVFRAPNAITGAGNDIAGADLTLTSGDGVGAGGSGNIIFQTAPVAASGNTADAMTEVLRITPTGALAFSGAANYGTAGQILKSNGNAAPSYQNIINGTINAVTYSPTATTIASATTATPSKGMYWDNVNGYLGIGQTLPLSSALMVMNGGASIGYNAAAPVGGLIVYNYTGIGTNTPGINILNVQGGFGLGSGPGIILTAGTGAAGNNGGPVSITGGNGGVGSGNGGTITLTPGTASGSGVIGSVNINGNLTITKKALATAVNGANNDLLIGNNAYVKLTGPTAAFSITGFTNNVATVAPLDGEYVILYNASGQTMTIANANAGSTAANRILTNTGANVNAHCATFIYDIGQTSWILVAWE
ncbi:MAG TPA: hypothetical protein VNZ86_17015 [Bacteroidia bacterium]|jgi:hypothetical protein|nr:hypothetical protein [Bacteroidia bacterium]